MIPLKRKNPGRHEMDMTEGPLLPQILAFSGPLILTGILQLLYNAADVIVVGNYAGHAALAAVSSTGALINLLVNVFMGLSVGASVVIARCYGARDVISLRKAEHTAMTLALFMGIGVGVFGFPVQDKRTACDKYHNERFARCLEGTEQILLRIGDGNVGTAGTPCSG